MYDSRTDKAYKPGTHRYLKPLDCWARYEIATWFSEPNVMRKPVPSKHEAIAEGLSEYAQERRDAMLDPRECFDEDIFTTQQRRWDEQFVEEFKRELTTFLIVDWTEHRRLRNRQMRMSASNRRK